VARRRNGADEIERMTDALDHIARVARASRTQTRRLRWIEARARCALDGTEDWKAIDLPRSVKSVLRENERLRAQLKEQDSNDEK